MSYESASRPPRKTSHRIKYPPHFIHEIWSFCFGYDSYCHLQEFLMMGKECSRKVVTSYIVLYIFKLPITVAIWSKA
jgi:hypothetical protein